MKRITQPLKITVVYVPVGYIDDDDYSLDITVNDNGGYKLTPFDESQKDLTVNQIVEEIKSAILEEIFGE